MPFDLSLRLPKTYKNPERARFDQGVGKRLVQMFRPEKNKRVMDKQCFWEANDAYVKLNAEYSDKAFKMRINRKDGMENNLSHEFLNDPIIEAMTAPNEEVLRKLEGLQGSLRSYTGCSWGFGLSTSPDFKWINLMNFEASWIADEPKTIFYDHDLNVESFLYVYGQHENTVPTMILDGFLQKSLACLWQGKADTELIKTFQQFLLGKADNL